MAKVVTAKSFGLYQWGGKLHSRPAPEIFARGEPSWLPIWETSIGEDLPLVQRVNFIGGDDGVFFNPSYATASQRFTIQRSQSYAAGEIAADGGDAFMCTVSGTTAGSAPSFSRALGTTTADGSVTWRCVKKVQSLAPNYDTIDGRTYATSIDAGYALRIGSTGDTGGALAWVPTYTANTITAPTADFIVDGIQNGAQITVIGALNNGVTATVTGVTATTITVSGTPFAAGTDSSGTAKVYAPMPSWGFTNRWFPPTNRAHSGGYSFDTITYYGLAEVAYRMRARLAAKPSKTLSGLSNAASQVVCQDTAQNSLMREALRAGSPATWFANYAHYYMFPEQWKLDLELTGGSRLKSRPSIYSAADVQTITNANDYIDLAGAPWVGATPSVVSRWRTRELAYAAINDVVNHEIQAATTRAGYRQGTRNSVTDAVARWYVPCLIGHLHQSITNQTVQNIDNPAENWGTLVFQMGLTCLALIKFCDRERSQGRNPNDFCNPSPPGLTLPWTTVQYPTIDAAIEKFCDWAITAPLTDSAGTPRAGLFSRNTRNGYVLHVYTTFDPGNPTYDPASDANLLYQSELMSLLALPYYWVADRKRNYGTNVTARAAIDFFDEGDLLTASAVGTNATRVHRASYSYGFFKAFNQRHRPILSHILPLRNASTGRDD